MPYQCGTGSELGGDRAAVKHHQVSDLDIVLVYSDGVSDNVYDKDFKKCVEENLHNGLVESLSKAADCLARIAHRQGKDPKFVSPFTLEMKEASKAGKLVGPAPKEFIGGKEDDVTVTVA